MHLVRVVGALAASSLALCLAVPAASAKEPPKPPPFWAEEPDGAARQAAWPEAARKQGVGGRAALRCATADDGTLKDCRVILETPPAMGFGAAAMKLAPRFRRDLAAYPGSETVLTVNWLEFDTPPDWLRRPTADDIMGVFPRDALREGKDGQAIIECTVTVQGALADCLPVWEKPADAGFGRAAVGLTPQLGMRPAKRKGVPVPAVVRIPINFKTYGRASPDEMKRIAPAALPWAEAPSYADVVAAYPEKARIGKLGGRLTLECQMTQEGRLRDCNAFAESPKGSGFAAAAKTLARKFRLEIKDGEERKLTKEILVHLPFVFDPAVLAPGKPVVGKPLWAGLPTADDMAAVIKPLKLAATARAQLDCVVQPTGTVGECKVVSEDPAGSGVGAAALALTPKFRLTTWTSEGLPTVGGTIRIPLRFEP